jgi:membrane protease YdiL (CAAX protease family)
MIANELTSSILQLVAFTAIPFLVYLITKKTYKGFFHYIGLYKPTAKSIYFAIAASIFFLVSGLGLAFWNPEIKSLMTSPNTVVGKIKEAGGANSFILIMIIAWIKTSLAEEILFRGFLGKRLMHSFGYNIGNLLQAFVFGLIHLGLFWALTKAGPSFLIFAFALSSIAGYTIGYIKEKIGNGSIVPGWIAHGLGNMLSFSILTFFI